MKNLKQKLADKVFSLYYKKENGRLYFRHIHTIILCTVHGMMIASGSVIFFVTGIVCTVIQIFAIRTDEKHKLIKEVYANKKEV